MRKVIIIGKNSNLTNKLSNKLLDCNILSSREILSSSKILNELKEQVNINIIFNNFQTAINLNKFDNLESYISNSIVVTSRILDFIKNNRIKVNKIIYTSSSSVYGNNILCNENDELKPMNLHASLKVANEKLVEKFCIENSIDYTIARIFNMYGGDDNFSIISKIIKAYKNNEELNIVNNGNAIRDFIHIEDVVDIYSKILDKKDIKILNIGSGNGSSIKNILDFLNNHNIKIKTKNIQREELKISTADISKLKELLKKDTFFEVEDYLKKELNI
ncbi:NAD(P)-dependent oxidoreductase [Arcobacter cryaerophilus gv. pseudocryaerophilus]|uniref:NAD(P)-dependent oxidoreductase n=3 Tax=unclassified Arcobacter TaxID=2593671 RepID=A0AA96L730_9BACT|nr:NAD(P)-dependent oxidoreductase [Arcobacter sp. AZ-2023]WPD05177.1 NAD(P)-dependent oxidoreductase [Arcobacter sp. DSM 115956]WPD07271.1 NAD(P)-dependent oxidoreductase [Arcobacter sp. DSM 115955]WNL31536.1 NAD(P)-dependent oxidoreductase [Arcobacter sp. AZ-2023]WNP37686.1 NAD(P)-dependent oxidoreductase [Arcobacter sp. AZ-2023]